MKGYGLAAAALLVWGSAQAASQIVELHSVTEQGIGQSLGSVRIDETEYGLMFTPHLNSLPPGIHGFHVHAKGSCEPAMTDGNMTAAGAAGGHFDPQNSGKHLGPYQDGHAGDLPALFVTSDGMATYPLLAPRIKKLSEISNKALMVHAGGDNHADHPKPLGGGGARFACGVIK
ncbi:superoxide dismutase [[Pantoea] beijingensis]|uniref:Superoxide dismutase [Cu-Zn] n=1 Tax=[Pantoea] beijingensis TaxID=1324864 RepID=A0A443IHR7_9GAMM|nr:MULTISPECIES: superoxide dismutase family protein [Erwiniaceae]RWR03541.1 superoxide dismutase [[Pantoea] beijingensis]